MARLSSMPTVPDDVMLDDASRSWSCPGVEAERYRHPARAHAEAADGVAMSSDLQSPSSVVRADATGRTVAEVMRLPTKLSEHAPLAAAADLLASGRVRLVVVVTKQDKPVGVVTPAHVMKILKECSFDRLGRITALEAATSGGAFLADTTSIRDAAERFATEDRDALIVVSSEGTLAGVLMACDLPLVVNWV
jgi:CBS-domain-containing membrane protein